MLSRNETIRQALAGMEPEGDTDLPVSFSGAVAQVNIISNATFTIDSLAVGQLESPQADQGEQLAELVQTLAVLESVTSSTTVTSRAVWRRVKQALELPTNRHIPVVRQAAAIEFLVYRLALVRVDLQRDPEIARKRSDCYRRCHGIAQQYGLYAEMRGYMSRRWGVASMRDLADEELWSLEAYLRDKERETQNAVTRSRPWPERP